MQSFNLISASRLNYKPGALLASSPKTLILFLLSFLFLQSRAAVFTVTNTLDDGSTGSLRWAINQVNLSTDTNNEIRFANGLGEIVVTSNLPALVKQVHVSGYANNNANLREIRFRTSLPVKITLASGGIGVNALFTLGDGASASQFSGIDFHIVGGANTAAAIYKAPTTTVRDVHVWGNSFNYDYTTNAPYPGSRGFLVAAYGIVASDKTSNTTGWYIGAKTAGIEFREGNLIANTIAANNLESIRVFNGGNFVIAGNFFGFKSDGVTPLYGSVQSPHTAFTNCSGFLIGADNSTNITFKRNIFSDGNSGVRFISNASSGTYPLSGSTVYFWDGNNSVKSNYFGVDRLNAIVATTSSANTIIVQGSNKNIIGGPNAWERNIFVGASTAAIRIASSATLAGSSVNFTAGNENIVENNYIGMGINGTTPGPNSVGVRISTTAPDAGSVAELASGNIIIRNRIAYNTGTGIIVEKTVTDGYTRFNTITENAIFQNGGLGIDLRGLGLANQAIGVDGNDGALSASTAAAQQHIDNPVINSVTVNSTTSATISGYIGNSPAGNAAFGGATIELFLADITPSPDNGAVYFGDGLSVAHGEGATYLGTTTADPNGLFTITVTGTGFTTSTLFTGTATISGSTSEFGPATSLMALPVTFGSINAQIKDGKLWVNFTSLKETNNSHFEIEASTDGTHFTKIGELQSKAVNGNSDEALDYEFTTPAPAALALGLGLLGLAGIGFSNRRRKALSVLAFVIGLGSIAAGCQKDAGKEIKDDATLFVRVVQVDKDGTASYSKTVTVTKK